MGIFVSTNILGYEIYKVEYKFEGPYYYMVSPKNREKVTQINFDVDKEKGGLKIIKLRDVKASKIPEGATPIFEGVTSDTFIPINANEDSLEEEKLVIYDDELFSILENKYLKHKCKYFQYHGVIEKVKYFEDKAQMGMDYEVVGTRHLYSFVDEQ